MYFPVSLKIKGRPCLVVGGGAVALQKARALHRAGARITVVTPACWKADAISVIAFLSALAEDERHRIVKRANEGRLAARKAGAAHKNAGDQCEPEQQRPKVQSVRASSPTPDKASNRLTATWNCL